MKSIWKIKFWNLVDEDNLESLFVRRSHLGLTWDVAKIWVNEGDTQPFWSGFFARTYFGNFLDVSEDTTALFYWLKKYNDSNNQGFLHELISEAF